MAAVIAGPTSFICSECVELCVEILAERGVTISEKMDWLVKDNQLKQLRGQLSMDMNELRRVFAPFFAFTDRINEIDRTLAAISNEQTSTDGILLTPESFKKVDS